MAVFASQTTFSEDTLTQAELVEGLYAELELIAQNQVINRTLAMSDLETC